MEKCTSLPYVGDGRQRSFEIYRTKMAKCAVTHNALSISDMVCVHIKPCKGERNDTYRNLIILSKEVSELVGATNPVKIGKLLKDLQLTEEMKDKINKVSVQ